jgi:hypothetical protein
MGETYSTHGNDGKCIQILIGKPEGVDERIILEWILG